MSGKMGFKHNYKKIIQKKISKASDIEAFTWGTMLEPIARNHIRDSYKTNVEELGLYVKGKYGGSPDGILMLNGIPTLLEIKCPKTRQITYRIPIEYWIQCQMNMNVWNIEQCLYAEYKFDLSDNKPNINDLTLIYGKFPNLNVYWIYQCNWNIVIPIDRQWFKNLKLSTILIQNHVKKVNCKLLSNYLRKDPILDLFSYTDGEDDLFVQYYNQINIQYKISIIRKFLHLKHVFLNESVKTAVEIYYPNLSINFSPNNCIAETKKAMLCNDVIFYGQLDDEDVYDTFDILIRSDLLSDLKSVPGFESIQYNGFIPIKIKLTTDPKESNAVIPYVLYDKNGNKHIIPKKCTDDEIKNAIEWVNNLPKTKLTTDSIKKLGIWPNMKNKKNGRFEKIKKKIATDIEELTLLGYMTVKNREILHSRGIFKISDLEVKHLTDLKYSSIIECFISKDLDLTMIKKCPTEIFMDFENVACLDTETIIYIVGVLVIHCDGPTGGTGGRSDGTEGTDRSEFKSFTVKELNKESEKIMLADVMNFIGQYQGPVFHWSHAEPTLLAKTHLQLPKGLYFVDLYKHFLQNRIKIPGMKSYNLKEVANALKNLGMIKDTWLFGNGTLALILALMVNHKCKITGEEFYTDPKIKKLELYNYDDVRIMSDIRKLLYI
jgi:hypothetical protein